MDYVTIDVDEVIRETDDAILVDLEGGKYWLPKSQLEDWPDKGEKGEVEISEWMAIEKGLI